MRLRTAKSPSRFELQACLGFTFARSTRVRVTASVILLPLFQSADLPTPERYRYCEYETRTLRDRAP